MLIKSIQGCKAVLSTVLSHDDWDIFFLTAYTFSKLCYTLMSLAKVGLAGIEEPWEDNSDSKNPSLTQRYQRLSWPTTDVAEEVDFVNLARQVQEKFNALTTDFVSPTGQRDAMWNFSSIVSIILARYDKQKRERAKEPTMNTAMSGHNSNLTGTTASDLSASTQTTERHSPDVALGPSFGEQDNGLQWEPLNDSSWDQIMDNLTMYFPYP